MSKVLHLFKTCKPLSYGGVESVISEMARDSRHCHRVLVVSDKSQMNKELECNADIDYIIDNLEQIVCLGSTPIPRLSIKLISDIRKIFSWCDIVMLHFPWPIGDLLYALFGQEKKLYICYHSDIIKQKYLSYLYAPIMLKSFKRASKIFTTSPNYAVSSQVLRRYKEKVCVIPLGISKTPCSLDIRLPEITEPYALYIGAHRYYKGLNYLVEAASYFKHTLILVGHGSETVKIMKMAKDRGIKNIKFMGIVSEKEKVSLLKGCSCFVLPSIKRSEAFGVCLLEAMMYAKPLITCEIGTGTSFVNINQKTGIVVPPRNANALANAIDQLMVDSEMALSLGRAAYERYNNVFSGDLFRSRYDEIFDNVR